MNFKWIKVKSFLKKEKGLNEDSIPLHIAIIPDGNGRWAKKRGMPRSSGHRAGANTLKNIVKYCNKIGVKFLTAYVFSTENWSRPKSEVDLLMNMLLEYLQNAERELSDSNIKIKVIGNISALSNKLQNEIVHVEKMTKDNTGLCLVFALNYGGRDELVHAAQYLAKEINEKLINIDDINIENFSKYLYTANIPDPDLVIRTSGEMRLSNFLLWQAAYAEFWYTNVLWPDFKEGHIDEAIESFQKRKRRYGGL